MKSSDAQPRANLRSITELAIRLRFLPKATNSLKSNISSNSSSKEKLKLKKKRRRSHLRTTWSQPSPLWMSLCSRGVNQWRCPRVPPRPILVRSHRAKVRFQFSNVTVIILRHPEPSLLHRYPLITSRVCKILLKRRILLQITILHHHLRRKYLSQVMTSSLSMLRDWWLRSAISLRNISQTIGDTPLRNSSLTMCGTLKTAGTQSSSSSSSNRYCSSTRGLSLTGSGSRAASLRCKNAGGDWLSISIRRRGDCMNSRKATSRALPRSLPLSRNSLRCSLKICLGHLLKMWLKRSYQAWFLLLVEWESLQILKELIINKIRKRVQLVELKVTLSKRAPLTVQTEPLRTVQLQPDNPAQLTLQRDP